MSKHRSLLAKAKRAAQQLLPHHVDSFDWQATAGALDILSRSCFPVYDVYLQACGHTYGHAWTRADTKRKLTKTSHRRGAGPVRFVECAVPVAVITISELNAFFLKRAPSLPLPSPPRARRALALAPARQRCACAALERVRVPPRGCAQVRAVGAPREPAQHLPNLPLVRCGPENPLEIPPDFPGFPPPAAARLRGHSPERSFAACLRRRRRCPPAAMALPAMREYYEFVEARPAPPPSPVF